MSEANAKSPEIVDHRHVIAIDGPAAAGKTTVARLLADRLGALLFDTGALYRAVTLAAMRAGISPADGAALTRVAGRSTIEVRPPSRRDGRLYDVTLDGEDVTWAVRDPAVGAIVSEVSEHAAVRAALLPLQRQIASQGAVVMVGRDVGTVVVPDAGLKIYLDASPEERARRRHREALARGGHENYAAVLRETMHRDDIDSTRLASPLRIAPDAIVIYTDDLTAEEVVAVIDRLARAHQNSLTNACSRS